jgi:hypothetical protein
MPKVGRFKYRPHVYFSAAKPAIPFDWKSHGYIGISTNDHEKMLRWKVKASLAGYAVIREAIDYREQTNAQTARWRRRMGIAARNSVIVQASRRARQRSG